MSIVASETFRERRERVERYVEQNPEASVPQILGHFLAEPTDEHQEFVAEVIEASGEGAPHGAENDDSEVAA